MYKDMEITNNRQIIFRAKRSDNGEWVRGSLVHWPDGDNSILLPSTRKNKESETEMEEHYVNSLTIGQFTGLTDKAGKPIYEHDILELDFGSRKCVEIVMFRDGRFVSVDPQKPYKADAVCLWVDCATTIGNVFDNPDMMKGVGNG